MKKTIMEEERTKIAAFLASVEGVGRRILLRTLEQCVSPENVFYCNESENPLFCDKKRKELILGSLRMDYSVELGEKTVGDELLERSIAAGNVLLREWKIQGIDFYPCFSEKYPMRLRCLEDHPFGLFVKGGLPEEEVPAVAIIGARACSDYGKKVTEYFAGELAAKGVRIISGMARGIDGIGQKKAIDAGGRTFGVLGCGVDVCYPKEHRRLYDAISEHGGIISEYRPGTAAHHGLFPERNRIISGLADVILVVEARKRSGTYITVTQALEQGKEIFVVPGRITDALSEGCNHLLGEGAALASSPEKILQFLNSRFYSGWKKEKQSDFNKSNGMFYSGIQEGNEGKMRKAIYGLLDDTPKHLNQIFEELKRTDSEILPGRVMEQLTEMVCDGQILGHGCYFYRNSTQFYN